MNRFFSKTSYWLIIGLIVCLTSCKVDKGKPLIGKDKMVEIIYDFYLTEGTLDATTIPAGHKRYYYYCHLLEKHGVTEAEFDSALVWYSRNTDDLAEVHGRVVQKLKEEKDKQQ